MKMENQESSKAMDTWSAEMLWNGKLCGNFYSNQTNFKLEKCMKNGEVTKKPYRELLGCLIYIIYIITGSRLVLLLPT
jgi:hypothetical protein